MSGDELQDLIFCLGVVVCCTIVAVALIIKGGRR